MGIVEIGKEKLRLMEQLNDDACTYKKLKYDLIAAMDKMEHTQHLLNLLDSFPREYFERFGEQIKALSQ